MVVMAAAVAVAMTATTLTPASSAQASEHHSVAAITESFRAGTITQDIASGRITVDDLVDADIAARTSGPDASARPDRAEITREVTAEVRQIQDPTASPRASTPIEVGVDATGKLTATPDPLAANLSWKSFWHHVTHWSDIYLSATALKIIVAGAAGVGAAFFCAIPGVNALSCGLFYALIGVLVAIFSGYPPCRQNGAWVTIPDVKNSHCA